MIPDGQQNHEALLLRCFLPAMTMKILQILKAPQSGGVTLNVAVENFDHFKLCLENFFDCLPGACARTHEGLGYGICKAYERVALMQNL